MVNALDNHCRSRAAVCTKPDKSSIYLPTADCLQPIDQRNLRQCPNLGCLSRPSLLMLPTSCHLACSHNLCAVAGLIFVLLKLQSHSTAVHQRQTGVRLLQSAAQAKRETKGSASKKKK